MSTPDGDRPRYDDLTALFVNCTLKRSPELSHTQGLIDRSAAIMTTNAVSVSHIRAVDHDIATGVWPDMTEHGWTSDEWPAVRLLRPRRRLPHHRQTRTASNTAP